MNHAPAAPAQVASHGTQTCPDCKREVNALYGLMYEDRTLRCADCHDDAFFADSDPAARAKAEAHRAQVLSWFLGLSGKEAR